MIIRMSHDLLHTKSHQWPNLIPGPHPQGVAHIVPLSLFWSSNSLTPDGLMVCCLTGQDKLKATEYPILIGGMWISTVETHLIFSSTTPLSILDVHIYVYIHSCYASLCQCVCVWMSPRHCVYAWHVIYTHWLHVSQVDLCHTACHFACDKGFTYTETEAEKCYVCSRYTHWVREPWP